MIGRLNHVAIAVSDIEAAAALYRNMLGATVSTAVAMPEHGVTTVFVELPNTKVELIAPLGDGSPLAGFLERNPFGGIHHICYEVADVRPPAPASAHAARACSATASPRSAPTASRWSSFTRRIFCGTLIELEQA